jgi:hypothetical protein
MLEKSWRWRAPLSETPALTLPYLVHGKGVEPIRLAAVEPKAELEPQESAEIERKRGSDDPRSPEIEGVRTR